MKGKRYVFSVNLLVEGDVENISIQNIEDIFEKILASCSLKDDVTILSTQIDDISDNENYGKCINCGDWASDKRYESNISQMSNGAKVDDQWYCDICLPEDHPNHF